MEFKELLLQLEREKKNQLDYWDNEIEKLKHINPYLPAILKWHSLHFSSVAVDTLQYDNIPTNDMDECIGELVDLGLLTDDLRIRDQYRLYLSYIASKLWYCGVNRATDKWSSLLDEGICLENKSKFDAAEEYLKCFRASDAKTFFADSDRFHVRLKQTISQNNNENAVAFVSEANHVIILPPQIDIIYQKVKALVDQKKLDVDRISDDISKCADLLIKRTSGVVELCDSAEFVDRCNDFLKLKIKTGAITTAQEVVMQFHDLFEKLFWSEYFGGRVGQLSNKIYFCEENLRRVDMFFRGWMKNINLYSDDIFSYIIQPWEHIDLSQFSQIDDLYAELQSKVCTIDELSEAYENSYENWLLQIDSLYQDDIKMRCYLKSSSRARMRSRTVKDLLNKLDIIFSLPFDNTAIQSLGVGQLKALGAGNVGSGDRQRTVSDAQRSRVLRRDNFTCRLCGAKGPGAGGTAELHVDHIQPFSLGGPDDDNNLWTLCASCNFGKSNKYDDTELANRLTVSNDVSVL